MFPRLGAVIGGLLLASEHHRDATFRIELHDHVRALVDNPDVVIFIDADIVRKRPGVKVVADLTYEFAGLIEFEQLGSGGAIGRAAGVTAIEHKDVLFRVEGDARGLTQINIVGQFQEINVAVERNFGNVLRKRHAAQGNDCAQPVKKFHGSSPYRVKGSDSITVPELVPSEATIKIMSENTAEPRARVTAETLASKQRDISVSEFFAKNRHLLGFDNPRKAL